MHELEYFKVAVTMKANCQSNELGNMPESESRPIGRAHFQAAKDVAI